MAFHPHSLETSGKVRQFQQLGHTRLFNLQQSRNNCTCAPWGNLRLRTPLDLSSLGLASLPTRLCGAHSPHWLCSGLCLLVALCFLFLTTTVLPHHMLSPIPSPSGLLLHGKSPSSSSCSPLASAELWLSLGILFPP